MFSSIVKQIKKTYQMAEPHGSKAVMGNVVSLSGLQAITYILPMIILPYLFRTLGPEKFGLISFAQAFVQYFSILTDYGFNASATKEISLCHSNQKKINHVYASVMSAKMILVLLSILALGLALAFTPKFQENWVVYVLSFGVVLGGALFPLWFFQGTEKMKHIADLNIIGGIAYAILIFLYVKNPNDYLAVPLITSCVSLTVGVMGQYVVIKQFKMTFQLAKISDIKHQIKAGWDIFIAAVAVNAYTTTRVFAVGLLTNNTLTGFYSIAEKIASAVQTFPLSSFSQAIFPRLSNIYQKNKAKAFEIMKQVQSITIKISFIFLPLIFLYSPFIIRLVCGGDYPAAVNTLRYLLVSILFISSNAFRVQFLLVCGKTDTFSKIHLTMAIMGLPLILLLISSYSYVGAAMATAIIEAGIFTLTYFAIKKLAFKTQLEKKAL